MSVIDDLRQAQERVVSRLQELEPLVAEYQQLRDEAERMGLSGAQQQAPDDSGPAAQSSRGSRSRSQSRSSQSGTTRRRAGTSSRAAGSGSGSGRPARARTSAAETTTSKDGAAAEDTTPATES